MCLNKQTEHRYFLKKILMKFFSPNKISDGFWRIKVTAELNNLRKKSSRLG